MKRFALFVVAVVVGAVGIVPAQAHDPAGFYPDGVWSSVKLTYKFRSNVPTGAFRNRVDEGAEVWYDVPGVTLDFVRGTGEVDFFSYTNCDAGPNVNTIHYTPLFDAYGDARLCMDGTGAFTTFRVAFNSSDPWYTGSSTPVPNTQTDVFSIGAHEFGHATGWDGHFTNENMCPRANYTVWQTMCTSIDVLEDINHGERGRHFRRTLEEHDKHTFEMAYD